jgi:hypothetical protein
MRPLAPVHSARSRRLRGARTSFALGCYLAGFAVGGLGCADDEGSARGDTDADTDATATDTEGTADDQLFRACEAVSTAIPGLAGGVCAPLGSDYAPGAADEWPVCASDDGMYRLIGSTPGALGRVEGYESISALLWERSDAPTADDFTAARTIYAEDQGLESRVLRREDLHVPPIPASEWDPGFDPDKQCTVAANVPRYPERCLGPSTLAPILNDAFAAGQTGAGEPRVQAERIHATLLWFFYLSIYKEAYTCSLAGKDCDSMWAKYTGGTERSGARGLSEEVVAVAPAAHARIWDGLLAIRCWRDLNPDAEVPTILDASEAALQQYCGGWEQLDNALHYGWSELLVDRLERQGTLTGVDAAANWAFAQVAGQALQRELSERGVTSTASLWAMDAAPDAATLTTAVADIRGAIPCP